MGKLSEKLKIIRNSLLEEKEKEFRPIDLLIERLKKKKLYYIPADDEVIKEEWFKSLPDHGDHTIEKRYSSAVSLELAPLDNSEVLARHRPLIYYTRKDTSYNLSIIENIFKCEYYHTYNLDDFYDKEGNPIKKEDILSSFQSFFLVIYKNLCEKEELKSDLIKKLKVSGSRIITYQGKGHKY